MFRLTTIGHQGFFVESDRTRVLLNPLLVHSFGHGGAVGAIWPPRELDISEWPPTHAVVLTREHENHFDIPSLNRLDRRIPIYLPARSSIAARNILSQMGFKIELVVPGRPFSIGDLEIVPMSSQHDGRNRPKSSDEYDSLALLVRDQGGDGNFYMPAGASEPLGLIDRLRGLIDRPAIWSRPCKFTDWSCMFAGRKRVRTPDGGDALAALVKHHVDLRHHWAVPAATVFTGDGFCFDGARGWLNAQAFPMDVSQMAAALRELYPEHPFVVGTPGTHITLARGQVVAHGSERPFVRPAARADWPDRRPRPTIEFLDRYPPTGGLVEFDRGDLPELLVELGGFARFLHATPTFRQLYSLDQPKLGDRKPTLALALLTSGDYDRLILEYDASACAFVEVACTDPNPHYVAVAECWANDLLSVLRGDLSPTAVTLGAMRSWHHLETEVTFEFDADLERYNHPLARPDRSLRLYRKLLAEELADVPHIRAAG